MGGKAIQKIDKNGANFLGDSDTKTYLVYYYESELQGSDEEKFKDFTKLIEDNESLQDIMYNENICSLKFETTFKCSVNVFRGINSPFSDGPHQRLRSISTKILSVQKEKYFHRTPFFPFLIFLFFFTY